RLEAYTGASVERLLPAAPLSCALEDPTSLTRTGATHAYTMFHGVRRQYHEAARHWLETTPPEEIPNAFRGESRPFPAPGLITKERRKSSQLDVLIVTDFNVQGGAYVSTMNYVRAALRAGLRVGLFQWRRYNLDAAKSLNPEVLSLAQTGAVELVTPGEEVHAQYVIVGYPVVLQHVIDMPPQLDCDHFLIVTNQFASRLTDGGDWQYEPSTISANVRRLFGKTPTWAPISGRVRELMLADGRYGPLHDQDWVPLIDTELWCARPLEWRGASRARPVVGRHGRDHYTKWPAEAGALKAAYCVGKPCEVRLLGGAAHAESMLGGRPSNWRVQDYGAMPAMEFLPELDFYVHYPHELYIEEFGRAVMEAMAMGIPAVLPPVFRSTFGEAAVYAEPGDVWDVVDTLWHDEQAYLQRARSGRDFVMRHCGHSRFSERLAAMETRPPSDAFDAQGS
ncbi:MAG: hypothetical protein LAT50_08350, partial [Ectothiorhodospiraceae bacterium]|nr:hypothetical protein [Ectothiorhodospiraceae bacterium]